MSTPHVEPALSRLHDPVPAFELDRLVGQASSRVYWRLTPAGGESLIVMQLPEDAFASDEGGDGPPPAELPFLSVGRLLHERGIRVPVIYAVDLPNRVILLEDLGDESFEDRLIANPDQVEELYRAAVDRLAQLHSACAELPPDSLPATRAFDRELLRWEMDHFREWGLEELSGPLTDGQRKRFDGSADALVDQILAAPHGFTHRDYQSRNLMWKGDELVLIDFQDALQGPRPYDLVALLCDSYVDLDESLQLDMIEYYGRARGFDGAQQQAFARTFWRVAVQRKLKDAGRFVYIDRVRGNPDFLPSFGQSIVYVSRALRQLGSELADLHALLKTRIEGFPDDVPTPPADTGSAPDRAY
ncbi:MAG: phosphotransferase [Deltaproteobacteria bacterium]|nr:phosphotransferase [Deltaproteobacteria bacterium]